MKSITKIALSNTIIYLIFLFFLSISISYIGVQISLCVKYAVDGIIFNNYNDIPVFINQILKHDFMYDILIIAIIIIIFNFSQKLLNYFRDRITTKFKLKINTNLKQKLYKHILNLEYESYNSYDKEEIIQRINEDADVYSNFFNTQFNVILDIIFFSIFIINESVELNWKISIYIILSIIVMLLFSIWYYRKLNKCITNMIIKRKDLLKATIRNINNYKFIRIFNKQKYEMENYKTINNDYTNSEIKFIKLVLYYDILLEHLAYLRSPIIYVIGGIDIIRRTNDIRGVNCFAFFCRKNI